MKLHFCKDEAAISRLRKIQAIAISLGVKLEEIGHSAEEDLSGLSPIATLPLLETPQGTYFSSNTIVRYLAASNGYKLYGGENLHLRALIDQWLDISACEFEAAVSAAILLKEGRELDVGSLRADTAKFLGFVNNHLKEKKYLVGDGPSIADLSLASAISVVFTTMFGEEERKQYCHAVQWYQLIASSNELVGPKNLPKEAHQAFRPKKAKKEQKEEKKQTKTEEKPQIKEKQEQKQQKQVKNEDGGDLFDDDAAPSAAPAEKQPAKKVEKKEGKKKAIPKSIVIFEVKVYDQEQDLDKLAQKIRKEINMDGLVWNKEHKIVPVAYGMNKIEMGCVIEDEKVSTEDIFERIEQWEEVQSTDTISFQKL